MENKSHRLEAPALCAGHAPEAIRISVGIEHPVDITADLDQAVVASLRQPHPKHVRPGTPSFPPTDVRFLRWRIASPE